MAVLPAKPTACIQSFPDKRPVLCFFWVGPPHGTDTEQIRRALDQVVAGRPFRTLVPGELPETARPIRDLLRALPADSYAVIPLQGGKAMLGAFPYAGEKQAAEWTPELRKELSAVADAFAKALEHKPAEARPRAAEALNGAVLDSLSNHSEEARAHLGGLLITAQEQERASIARELHDHINQRLAVLAIGLQAFEQSATGLSDRQRNDLEELWTLTNEISYDVQALSHQLHSSQLQHLGLVTAVRNLCQEFSRSAKVEVEFTSSGVQTRIDECISLGLFRIAQEALRNVARYSQAGTVKVELEWKPDQVALSIADDGVGFEPAAVSDKGLGLVSMRERMRLVGGELSVVSRRGEGTRIEARVPLVAISQDERRTDDRPDAEPRKHAA